MTSAERASLERLEDMLGRRLDRLERKIDDIDTRLRNVETSQAEHQGAVQERKESSASRIEIAGVILACGLVITAVPACVYTIITLLQLVTR